MGADSKIQWTDHTFNPWIGCTKVSPGCDHCYAEAFAATRMHKVQWGPGAARRRTSEHNWREPLRWSRQAARMGVRLKVLCASLADVFDNEVDPRWRADLFALIGSTPSLDWMLLTKRIGNVRQMIHDAARTTLCLNRPDSSALPPNAWLGATVVNQEEADRDIPKLLATPAAVRFLSIEPILGEIDLRNLAVRGGLLDCLTCDMKTRDQIVYAGPPSGVGPIDWVIVGGESGPKARDTEIGWIESIVRQCKAASVPVFVKQMGDKPVWVGPRDYGKKGGDVDRWPTDLRVREFPR